MSRRFTERTGTPPVIDNQEEIEMSKRNNVGRDEIERGRVEWSSSRGGGGGLLLLLVGLVAAGWFGLPVLSAYLAEHATDGAGAVGDINVGAWAVGIVLAVFLAWCFLSGGSKGGR